LAFVHERHMGMADVCLTTIFIRSPKNTGDDNSLDTFGHFCGSNPSYIHSQQYFNSPI